MTFTQIPQQYAPAGGELRYSVKADAPGIIDIRIYYTGDDTPIGAKRFAGVSEASFDVGPYLNRKADFAPKTCNTGIYQTNERTATITVEAEICYTDGNTEYACAPERCFLPCRIYTQAPALLTSMPRARIIAQGESEELTLFTDKNLQVSVMAHSQDTTMADVYNTECAGLHVFVLNVDDFPGADGITVDIEGYGAVEYAVIHPVGGRRLAWRSAAGSIEHYTFTVEKSETIKSDKKRAYGPEGYVTARITVERRIKLVSAYETRKTLEALSGILTARQAWRVDGTEYSRIDILSDEAVIYRQGSIGCLEGEIRDAKTHQVWN